MMRVFALLSLLLGVQLALPQTAAAQSRIEIGDEVEGRLTSSDARDQRGRPQDRFLFSGEAGEVVTIALHSSARLVLSVTGPRLSRSLRLRRGQGEIELVLPATGTYRVAVTGGARGVTGEYELALFGAPPPPPPQPEPLPPPPAPVIPPFPDLPGAELRRFYLLPGERYGAVSGELPFGVILLKQGEGERNRALCESFVSNILPGDSAESNGTVIATYWLLRQDVGAAGQGNCNLLLQNYDYTRAAQIMSDYQHSGAGPALLALQLEAGRSEPAAVLLLDMSRYSADKIREVIGDWYNVIRSSGGEESRGRGGFFRQVGNFFARTLGLDRILQKACRFVRGGDQAAGQVIRYFDNELGLGGTIVRFVDGNSLVALGRGVINRLCPGDEPVAASTSNPPTASAPPAPALLVDQPGSLGESDPQLSRGEYYDAVAIDLTAGQPVRIELTSGDFDAFLVLRRGGETVAQNDDMADGVRNARIDFTPQVSGSYVIWATSYDGGKTGRYRLTARRTN